MILLDASTPGQFARFLSIGDRLLLMLDVQNMPLLSSGAWSYTFNSVPIGDLDALAPQAASD